MAQVIVITVVWTFPLRLQKALCWRVCSLCRSGTTTGELQPRLGCCPSWECHSKNTYTTHSGGHGARMTTRAGVATRAGEGPGNDNEAGPRGRRRGSRHRGEVVTEGSRRPRRRARCRHSGGGSGGSSSSGSGSSWSLSSPGRLLEMRYDAV
jgi:hypothetical protein